MYRWLGYVIKFGGVYIYHAGDTSVNDVVISELERFKNIDMALIPVNERNYYRERRGIIGNMSIREAFKFAEDIGANKVFPTHWDMFEQNSVFQKEIELMYELLSPEFELLMDSEVA